MKSKDKSLVKYSDLFMQTLKKLGYTHCFFVAGGNSMHLLESAEKNFSCIPVIHEVSAVIAVEYFNKANKQNHKAFALVTAGPGLTNAVTAIAGAWIDSREVLVIGGQVKSSNLSSKKIRQLGIQEVAGAEICKPITKNSVTLSKPINNLEISKLVSNTWELRKGPVFVEICLDVTSKYVKRNIFLKKTSQIIKTSNKKLTSIEKNKLKNALLVSKRPLLLLGGGVDSKFAIKIQKKLEKYGFPIACTWNGAQNCGVDYKYYAGRPNNFGMRWANIFQQQADLLIAVGTSLGYQQTGFNTKEYLPLGKIYQIDIDENELKKSNPKKREIIQMDSNIFLNEFINILISNKKNYKEWTSFLKELKLLVPTLESSQKCLSPYLSPHQVINKVSKLSNKTDTIVSCSSGGTFTAMLQCFENVNGQSFISNKGLASMGYGLAGAIGASIAQNPKNRTILFEGDGGFAQNIQELGIISGKNLNIKIFITDNDGYASIKTSQKNYFNGNYIGCDKKTGLFLPNWKKISDSFGIDFFELDAKTIESNEFLNKFKNKKSAIFLIKSDPDLIYTPRIESKILADGNMVSRPLHDMTPTLANEISGRVFKYLSI